MKEEYLNAVSVLQQLAGESIQTLSTLLRSYDNFDKARKEGRPDAALGVQVAFTAKPRISEACANYQYCYDRFKDLHGLGFLRPRDLPIPLTSDNQINGLFREIYLGLEELRMHENSVIADQIPAVRACLQKIERAKSSLDKVVKDRYGSSV